MSSVEPFSDVRGAYVAWALRPSRLIKTLRKTVRAIRAAIAVAKLRRLRNELLFRRGTGATIELDARHRPQAPLLLGDKWDF
ncbi:hypothetical protein [Bradyrhizobium sp. HKCCYLS2033]|uniref:hypothetical protein n=1 Tax=unclassified Bradyrhizobium TaxID=2631580 RepID=UPI003EC0A920